MNGLVPERRTNRNGVTQTKWVRPDGCTAAEAAPALPGPALAATEDDATLLGKAGRIVADLVYEHEFDPGFGEVCDEILSKVSGRCALVFAEDCLNWGLAPQRQLAAAVAALLSDGRFPEEHREAAVMNYLAVVTTYDETVNNDEGDNAPHFAAVLFAALDPQEASAPFDATQREVYRQAARGLNAVALADVPFEDVGLGWDEDAGRAVLPSLETVEVLLEHPEKAETIIDGLIERKTFLPETALAIAESGVLGDGTL